MTTKPKGVETVNAITVREPGAADISIYEDGAFLPAKETVDYWLSIAEKFVQSKITPVALDTPAKVLAVWLYAREMGIQAMRALGKLYVVDGHVGMYGELMVEQARRGGVWFKVLEHDQKICRIRGYRPHPGAETETHEAQFTYEEAVGAGLAKKTNWQRYRRDMLQWRATARLLRFLAPDLVHNSYLPDEIRPLQTVMTDFPPGSPEYIEHTTGRKEITRATSPGVARSERKPTGRSRIGPDGDQGEPEGGQTAAERAARGGSGSDQDAERPQNGTSTQEATGAPVSGAGGSTPEDTDVEGWTPSGGAFGPSGQKGGMAPRDARHADGWKGFVTGIPVNEPPDELGPRAATWWTRGWRSACSRVVGIMDSRDHVAANPDDENVRLGAYANLDLTQPASSCPHPKDSRERFFWMTGFYGAPRIVAQEAAGDEPAEDAPGEEASGKSEPEAPPPEPPPFDRETWEAEAVSLLQELNIGVSKGQKILEKAYGQITLYDINDDQLRDFVTGLKGVQTGDSTPPPWLAGA